MTNNPECPQCGNPRTIRKGISKTGAQRYQCTNCHKSYSVLPRPQGKAGRPTINDQPLTPYERLKRTQKSIPETTCTVCGKPAPYTSLKLCPSHYALWRYHQRKD